MDTKLTLKLDKHVIDKAKEYASIHKRSLSRIIESYLKLLIDKESFDSEDQIKISPFVKSMSSGVIIQPGLDYKKEYGDYLSEKHK